MRKALLCILLAALLSAVSAQAAEASGELSGEVRDARGAVIDRARATLLNRANGLILSAKCNHAGIYTFADVPVGRYDLKIESEGFAAFTSADIQIHFASALHVDARLQVAAEKETVRVDSTPYAMDTASTQTGEVIEDKTVAALPLNGRSFTDLLALQAGVTPVTTLTASTVQGLGQSVFSPSGDLNAGVLSIDGQRESANGYIINGANAEETGSLAAAIVPNLDSIAEFRILVNNMDAEYGRYSGGQVNVITRSGSNAWHGDAFEFLRNTSLDAANYFAQGVRGRFQQNQYGATLGGPIRKDRIFFFADYQGTRQIQGKDTGLIEVPTQHERSGDFCAAALASQLSGAVNGDAWAASLSAALGYPVGRGEPYYFDDCTSSTECVLPNAQIPQSAWSAPAKALLQYIPASNLSDGVFSSAAYNMNLHDDKSALRIDDNLRHGRVSAYYAYDRYDLVDPYPTSQGGANVPGFSALSAGGSQLLVLSHDRTIGNDAFNQLHLSYTRVNNDMGKPQGGLGVSLQEQGFVTGTNTLGIVTGDAADEGVANIAFNNFTIGVDPMHYRQINNTYELSDDLARIFGRHTVKAGLHVDFDQINTDPFSELNGGFQELGSETGLDFADFLLGIATQYNQNGLRPFYEREQYWGAYLQDSWRALPNVTINGGVRWERISPWSEKYNNAMTLVAGEQSQVFPTAPEGIVYPGDPGIARTIAAVSNFSFVPRIGIAWAPSFSSGSLPGKILGEAGKSSLRAGFGIYASSVPGESLGLVSDNAPYGFTYQSPAPPLLTTPFVDAATGNSEGQRFPVKLAPLNVSRSNPDASVDWSQFEPIAAVPGYSPNNKNAYAVQYMLSWQRQVGKKMLLDITYAGNQAHHLLVLKAANPGDPALCLALASEGCGPFGESGSYTTANGVSYNGTRTPLGPEFGSVSNQLSIGNSMYNALKLSARISARRGDLLFGYTYSKSIDQGSNFGDQLRPDNPALSRELASFDLRQNLVVTYTVHSLRHYRAALASALLNDWDLAGTTRMATGFPVTLINNSDTSLWGTQGNGVNNLPVDEPDYFPGPLQLNHNPRNGKTYFNTNILKLPVNSGDPGNARRRFFSGPGIDNTDLSVQKSATLHEGISLALRIEAFNVFNHAQFFGPQSVYGNCTDPTEFGTVVSAASPRLMQAAMKILF
jgi:hypothetical protein